MPGGGDNAALVAKLLDELWNKKNVAIVDELVAKNYVEHTLFLRGGEGTQASELQGSDALKELASSRFTLFTTLQIVIMDQIAVENKVSTRFTWDGTAHHPLPDELPDQAKVMGVSIDRIVDNKIVETWNLFDGLYRLQTALSLDFSVRPLLPPCSRSNKCPDGFVCKNGRCVRV